MKRTISGYITNLGKYNEGELIGKWIDFPIDEDELHDVLKEIGISDKPDENGMIYEEYFFTDWESPIEFGEYENIDEINEIAERWDTLDEYEKEACEKIMDEYTEDFNEAFDIVEGGTYRIYYDCFSMADVARQYAKETGLLDLYDDFVIEYFDYDKYGRRLKDGGNFYYVGNGEYLEIW